MGLGEYPNKNRVTGVTGVTFSRKYMIYKCFYRVTHL